MPTPLTSHRPAAGRTVPARRHTRAALLLMSLLLAAASLPTPAHAQPAAPPGPQLPDPLTLESALAVDDQYTRNLALYRLASRWARQGRINESAALLDHMNMPLAELSTLRDLANVQIQRDNLASATGFLTRAVEIVDQLDDFQSRKLSYLDLAVLQGKVGDIVGSRKSFKKAGRMIREDGRVTEQREAMLQVITVQARVGDFQGAMATAEFHGSVVGEKLAMDIVTVELLKFLRPLARPGNFDQALALVEDVEAWKPQIAGYAVVGAALRRAEQTQRSDAVFARAFERYEKLRRPAERIEALRVIANLQLECDHPDAEVNYLRAFDLADALPGDRRRAAVGELVDAIALAGSLDDARSILERVENGFERTVGMAVLANKHIDRREFLPARTTWNGALEARGRIADSALHD